LLSFPYNKQAIVRIYGPLTPPAEAIPLIRHLLLSPHRALAADLQGQIKALRARMATALDEAWKDRGEILDGVVASGGAGLGGNVEPARALERVDVKPWNGVGRLV
jgi:hypothetical protein